MGQLVQRGEGRHSESLHPEAPPRFALRALRIRDRVVAADPGLIRLRMGARASATTALTALVVSRVAQALGKTPLLALVGAGIAMMAVVAVADADRRGQRLTMLVALPVAAAGLLLGTLLGVGRAAAPSLIATVFVAVWARRFGARGNALGMLGFISYFYALFFRAPLSQLPFTIGAVAIGLVIATLFRTLLLPDPDERDLGSAVRVFEARARETLETLRTWLCRGREADRGSAGGGTRRGARRHVRAALEALDESALDLEDRLENDSERAAELSACVYEVEVSVERIAETARHLTVGDGDDADRDEKRRALAGVVAALADAWRRGETKLAVPGSPDPFAARALERATHVLDKASRVHRKLAAVVDEERRADASTTVERATVAPPNAAPSSTRAAVQASLASGLAFWAGHQLSSTRWYWAVLASFVVFNRTTTRGDTWLRAAHRVVGTVMGVAAGLLIALLLGPHPRVELVLLFVCTFLAFHAIRRSYAWAIFWMTAVLALLYGLLGRFTATLMYLRIEETVVGAGIAAVVASLVLPERTFSRVRDAGLSLLRGVADRLRGIAEGQPIDRSRALERELRTLREVAKPFTARALPARLPARLVRASASLVYCTRHLAETEGAREVAALIVRVANEIDAVADAVEQGAMVSREPLGDAIDRARAALPNQARAVHWLARIDATVAPLAEAANAAALRPRTLRRPR